jgi:hypothetical protein
MVGGAPPLSFHDGRQQAGQGFQRGLLLLHEVVSSIHPCDAGDRVVERGLDDVGQQLRRSCSTQCSMLSMVSSSALPRVHALWGSPLRRPAKYHSPGAGGQQARRGRAHAPRVRHATARVHQLLGGAAAGAATSLALALLVGGRVFAVMKRSLGVGEWVRRVLSE